MRTGLRVKISDPSYYALGSNSENRLRNDQSIYCDFDNYGNARNSLRPHKFFIPEQLGVIRNTYLSYGGFVELITIEYGCLHVYPFAENVLIEAELYTLEKISERLRQAGIETKYAGLKPFLEYKNKIN